jgi:TRAP-type C4-dicarboxylate transport system permease small subunit
MVVDADASFETAAPQPPQDEAPFDAIRKPSHPEERRQARLEGRVTLMRPKTGFAQTVRRTMDLLYRLCAIVAGSALVLIALVVPWGVYTRYVLNGAASWPEPMAILLSVVLTFFGAAMCYRSNIHMRVTVVRDALPPLGQRLVDLAGEALMIVISLFMVIWGARLCAATWHQVIAEFPALSVGITYLPIPVGGVLTLLFIVERLVIGPPPRREDWRMAAPD